MQLQPRRQAARAFHAGAAAHLVAAGLCGSDGARVWVRSDRPGLHRLVLDGGEPIPFEVPADPALDGTAVVFAPAPPGAVATYTVAAADGTVIGSGRFHVPPADAASAPDRFAIATASCHQPFAEDGTDDPASTALLDRLVPALDAAGVRAVLLLGDQMYADLPHRHDLYDPRAFATIAPSGRARLLDCDRSEIRAIFQARYRAFWRGAGIRALQSRFATLCMHDDHELVDNWGTHPDHGSPDWAALREGALDATHDYQLLRCHDRPRADSFPTRFAWGPLAGLVLDGRSARRVLSPERIAIYDEAQWDALDAFLEAERDRPVVALGLGVPLLHVPEWAAVAGAKVAPWGSGIHDRWSHPCVRGDRDRLVHRLIAHRRRRPDQTFVLLSGDVHVGVVTSLRLGDAPPILQVVSSGLSNLEREPIRRGSADAAELGPTFTLADGTPCAAELLPGAPGADANPWIHLNAAVLDFVRDGERWRVGVRLLAPPEDEGPVREVYRAEWSP